MEATRSTAERLSRLHKEAAATALQRPTQAQLRWAHFHRGRRSRETQIKLDKLWQNPPSVDDVDGARTEDGISSSCSSGEDSNSSEEKSLDSSTPDSKLKPKRKRYRKKKKHAPLISKGHRALLRVSQRRCEERKKRTTKCRGPAVDKVKNLPSTSTPTDTDRAYIRGLHLTYNEDYERLRRFETAISMMAAAPSADAEEANPTMTKRWRRSANVTTAVSIDGRQYMDLQRGGAIKQSKDGSPRLSSPGNDLQDKSASWMCHLTKRERRIIERQGEGMIPANLEGVEEVLSPGQDKINELIDKVQRSADNSPAESFSSKSDTKIWFSPSSARSNEGSPRFDDASANLCTSENFNPNVKSYNDQSPTGEDGGKICTPLSARNSNSFSTYGTNDQNHQFQHTGTSTVASPNHDTDQNQLASPATNYTNQTSPSYNPFNKLGSPGTNMTTPKSKASQVYSSYPYDDSSSNSSQQEPLSASSLAKLSSMPSMLDTNQGTIIDSDLQSDIHMSPLLSNMALSPTLLNKRHRQAIHAIETYSWEKVSYLLSANPWLAEMKEPISSQILLHELALHGTSAPPKLCQILMDIHSEGVQKYDVDGNLPIHMVARSGSATMLQMLGEAFPGGASVKNNDGMLPLHLAVMSGEVAVVEQLVDMFGNGVSVQDNEGNLPLHYAAREGNVDMVEFLLDRDQQVKMRRSFDEDQLSVDFGEGEEEEIMTDSGMLKNNLGFTPLFVGIRSRCGWECVEALLNGNGGKEAATAMDSNKDNILHIALSGPYADPASVLAILKVVPHIAAIPNGQGIIPVEAACMYDMPREVILGLILVDLPIDLDTKEQASLREGYGSSWWYLACDCDDAHFDIVREILSICSYHQIRELCFMQDIRRNNSSVISCATPKCKMELRRALRFVGRYEFLGSKALKADAKIGLKVFDAMDFGDKKYDNASESKKRVLLKCFGMEESFENEISVLLDVKFLNSFVEEVHYFAVHEFEAYVSANAPKQFCVVVERPDLTLARVVTGMPKGHELRNDKARLARYLSKVCMVLRLIAKCIRHLHTLGIVHGDVGSHNCGKYGDSWKLMGLTGCRKIEDAKGFDQTRLGEYAPPESVNLEREGCGRFHKSVTPEFSTDIWSFGKLIYEVIVGAPLLPFCTDKKPRHDHETLSILFNWDQNNINEVMESLRNSGVGALGADLVSKCLSPNQQDRPKSIDDVLKHAFWRDVKRKAKSLSSKRKTGHGQ